jgi:hypothetical protein
MARQFSYPVFAAQGGGLVREVNGTFIFIEKPDCPGLDVGDEMPTDWDYQPVNAAAKAQLQDEEVTPPWNHDPAGVRAHDTMPDRYRH